jgi:hypothetical protein
LWQPPSDHHLLDRWRVPIEGAPDEFDAFAEIFIENGFRTDGKIADALYKIRFGVGKIFGWDDGESAKPRVIHRERDQAVLGLSNKTISGMIDLRWVDAQSGMKTAEFSIYIKYVSRLSSTYMAIIKPFRYAIVYPAWMKRLKRLWESR